MQKSTRSEMKMALGDLRRCKCGKPIYDKKGAVTARNARMRRDRIALRVYECDRMNGVWHLTKTNVKTLR